MQHLPYFEYRTVQSAEEAFALWSQHPQARYLAGGTDLLPQLRARRYTTELVIDVKRIPEFNQIREMSNGSLAIGAGVCMTAVAEHKLVRERYSLLSECCLTVGAYPLRNRATVAGNICNASPAADSAAALLALDAEVVTLGKQGKRLIPLNQFFQGPGKCALEPGELVTEIVLPASAAGFCGGYYRMARRKGMDLATLGVLVGQKQVSGATQHRLTLVAVAPTPLRVYEAEKLLEADGCKMPTIKKVMELAKKASSPITDIRGSAEYRRDMVGVLTGRGFTALAEAKHS